MRGILRLLRAALAAMSVMVLRTVQIGGKLVSMLVPGSPVEQPLPPDLGYEEAVEPAPAKHLNRFERIRELAAELIQNPDVPPAEMLRGIGPQTASWLAALDDVQLAKLMMSSDEVLADHIAGRRTIRGVIPHDPKSVSDYVRAISHPAPGQTHEDDMELAFAPSM